ncbi:unnamed protein product [Fraxinus pennsylvanica]|uniref:RanBP2-type domain-containing protein n=1 Tax=Fraxinus pennsylvanica TaxID=56036 RepID=A0AAD2DWI5_9LAMI|nr:unnamed protein product [Fraxinus pennsylvanica]
MSREGDWICSACNHFNFRKRNSCQRCTCPKDATEADLSSYGLHKSEVLPGDCYAQDPSVLPGWKTGDWICNRCGLHNYASRVECFKCNSPRDFGGAMCGS